MVKGSDSKSDGVSPRRFESYWRRKIIFVTINHYKPLLNSYTPAGLAYSGVSGVTVSMVAFQAADPGSTPG